MTNSAQLPLISKSTNNLLKIIFEMLVLLHHLSFFVVIFGRSLITFFGPLAVSGFFFCSGYGIGLNYKKKGFTLSKDLLISKVPKFYLIIIITNICYLLRFFIIGNSFETPFHLIGAVLNLHVFSSVPILSNWLYFISDLMLYYLLFVLFSYIFRYHAKSLLYTALSIFVLGLLAILVLTIINSQTGGTMALRGCLLFPIGLLACYFNDDIVDLLNNKLLRFLIVINLFIAGGLLFLTLTDSAWQEYLFPIFFILSLVTLFYKVDFKSKIVDFFSKLVIYVYLSHEFFFKTIPFLYPKIPHLLNVVLTLVFSLIVSIIIHFIIKGLKPTIKKRFPKIPFLQ
ncbi:MAG: acyltransferase [Clostridiales bacterium]|nr:acyltransferase [Clostridiales bacterium]